MIPLPRPTAQLLFIVTAAGLALALGAAVTQAQVLATLHDFSSIAPGYAGTNSDGESCLGALTPGPDGNLYGTTSEGGTNSTGTVFRISPAGDFSTIHTFSAKPGYTNADGAYPSAGLVLGADGALYGTTAGGGQYGNFGTVFKIDTNAVLTTLHTFNYADGENSAAPLVPAPDGGFYGTEPLGGDNGNGTIFHITPAGDFQTLYSMSQTLEYTNYSNADGSRPYGITAGPDGALYGVAQFGGTNSVGTVFRFDPASTNFLVLHTFTRQDATKGTNTDGAAPQSPMALGSDGNLYGATPDGGELAGGVLFRITPGGVFTTLHNFDYFAEGANADAPLLFRDGYLYGATSYGESESGVLNSGSIFRCDLDGALSVLYTFAAPGADSINSGGAAPLAGLLPAADGSFYGTTTQGGADGNGTVFRFTPPLLRIEGLGGGLVRVSWPTNQAGLSLYMTPDPSQPAWTAAAPAPAMLGADYVVTNSVAGAHLFYRLSD